MLLLLLLLLLLLRVPRSYVGALHGGYVGSYVGLGATAGALGCARRGAGVALARGLRNFTTTF